MAKAIELWPVSRLVPYDRNARTHDARQVAQIVESIRRFGFTNPILVDTNAGILAGHGRLEAAKQIGLRDVPVIVLDHLSETERRAYIIADNKLALNAGWDESLLRLELTELAELDFDLGVIGFSDDELNAILEGDSGEEKAIDGKTDEDHAPELEKVAISRVGDVWIMGGHRLLVGDSTKKEHVARLMGGEHADLVFTDPPYNVDYEGYTKEKLKIKSDKMTPALFEQFLRSVFDRYREIVKTGSSMYVCHASLYQREFQNTIEAAGFSVRCQIIWAKNTFAWGFGRYKFQHEPIFYCHVAGASDAWYGDKSQSTLWQEKKPAANRLHTTMKPVELVERALRNSSKAGDIVVDLFGGSGSTMIACERLRRNCRLMDLDPLYADVIVKRWQEYVGSKAILEGSDATFDEIQKQREDKAAA